MREDKRGEMKEGGKKRQIGRGKERGKEERKQKRKEGRGGRKRSHDQTGSQIVIQESAQLFWQPPLVKTNTGVPQVSPSRGQHPSNAPK